MEKVYTEMGVNIVEVELSKYSQEFYPTSNFSACVYDVSIGHLDSCLGLFDVSPDRILLSGWSPDIVRTKCIVYMWRQNWRK